MRVQPMAPIGTPDPPIAWLLIGSVPNTEFVVERCRGHQPRAATGAAPARAVRLPQPLPFRVQANSLRSIFAASTMARIFPSATSRGRYFMPQSGASTTFSFFM